MEEAMTSIERIDTAIALKEPDRVPVAPLNIYINAANADPPLTIREFLFDMPKAFKAVEQVMKKIGMPDTINPPGAAFDHYGLIGPSSCFSRWFCDWTIRDWDFKSPGGNIPSFSEKPVFDDYDELMEEGFAPLMFDRNIMNASSQAVPIDEILHVNFDLVKEFVEKCIEMVERLRIPVHVGSSSMVPFDLISLLRGPVGTATDLYRRPDKIKQLSDWLTEYQVVMGEWGASVLGAGKLPGAERIFFWSGRASATFMSPEMWEEVVWPYVKKIVDRYVKDGYVAYLHWDGNYTPMLETMKDLTKGLPKGRIVADFEKTDMAKAKETIGDRICIYGNLSSSLLVQGTPREVEKACKKLVEECAEGGGFILGTECETPWNAKLENVRKMVEFTKEYGQYRK